jgi:ribulose-5-phosphate 4-epimerase/fuculose-1-phosphate aldolase
MTESQSDPQLTRRSFLSGAAAMSVFSLLKTERAGAGQNTASGHVNALGAPSRIADTEDQRLSDLVIGNHILFDQGIVDAFGHISVRSVKDPTHFFLSQSRAPGLVERDDIIEFDLDSKPIDQRGRPLYNERFIHGEIYRARPDVQSVAHSHATGVIPFAVTGVALRPLIHTAGFLPQSVPTFEIRDAAGQNNGILVSNNALGVALAKALGDSPVILMRGHGMTVVGPSVRHSVYRAIYTQLNAQIQLQSMLIGSGKITFLNPMEAASVDGPTEGNLLTEDARQWNLWATQAKADSARLLDRDCPAAH